MHEPQTGPQGKGKGNSSLKTTGRQQQRNQAKKTKIITNRKLGFGNDDDEGGMGGSGEKGGDENNDSETEDEKEEILGEMKKMNQELAQSTSVMALEALIKSKEKKIDRLMKRNGNEEEIDRLEKEVEELQVKLAAKVV